MGNLNLNTTRPRVSCKGCPGSLFKCSYSNLNQNSITARKSITLTAIWTNATDIHAWGSNSGDALETFKQYVNHFFPQLHQSVRLSECPYPTCHQIIWYIGIKSYYRDGIVPWRWNHTIPWEWNHTKYHPNYHAMDMESYQTTIIPYHPEITIPYKS